MIMSKVIEEYVDDVMIGLLDAVDYVEKGDMKLMRKVIKTTVIEVQNLNIDIVSKRFSLADVQRLLNTCNDLDDAKILFE